MARLIAEQGAAYMKDLDETVTHLLICGEAQDLNDEDVRTPKLIWALDQNKGRQRQRLIHRQRSEQARSLDDHPEPPPDIHIVWAEWMWDSLTSGGM